MGAVFLQSCGIFDAAFYQKHWKPTCVHGSMLLIISKSSSSSAQPPWIRNNLQHRFSAVFINPHLNSSVTMKLEAPAAHVYHCLLTQQAENNSGHTHCSHRAECSIVCTFSRQSKYCAALPVMICPPNARLHLPVYHVESAIGDSQSRAGWFSLAGHIH